MEYVYLGRSGMKVSTLCLGTMTFGTVVNPEVQCDEETSYAILDAFVAAGGNFIDTADVYQNGESERVIGRWLEKHPGKRAKLVLATKVRGAVDPDTAGPNDVGLSRGHIIAAVDDSLARLKTPYIDLLQCHVWDAGTPVEVSAVVPAVQRQGACSMLVDVEMRTQAVNCQCIRTHRSSLGLATNLKCT
jgi:aryl-alcohol dehydrogenase-like predicted oxidoreductase